MGRIPLLHLFRRPDQHEVQRHNQGWMNLRFSHPQTRIIGGAQQRAIPQDVKIEVAVRDGGRCRQCGSNKELHFDHVIPWSKGGPNTVDNIQLLCGTCNRRKGADDIPRICRPHRTGRLGTRLRPACGLRSLLAPISHHHPVLYVRRRGSRPARFAGCCLPSIPARFAITTGRVTAF